MDKKAGLIIVIIAAFVGGFFVSRIGNNETKDVELTESMDTIISIKDTLIKQSIMEKSNMKLGAFSMSLSVKDLNVSKVFYEKLGFIEHGGGLEMNYLIMKNENALIGLFQGMFDGNILTFNPGWNEKTENIESFDDVRVIQKDLKDSGVQLMTEASDSTNGPASIMLTDPDGNLILIDQHR